MCGLAGVVANGGVRRETLERLADAQAHRGPDGRAYLLHSGAGSFETAHSVDELPREGRVGLAHLRLAIIDRAERNAQPMLDERRRRALIFNGEIYNYVELRAELERRGRRFRTSGDTEVLLHAYDEWGQACVERFVGMWAFAVIDLDRREAFLSRDRFGVKPLYYARTACGIAFASEIKALLAAGVVTPEPCERQVARYLLTGRTDVDAQTFFEGVHQLPAAHGMRISLDAPTAGPQVRRYWTLPTDRLRISDDHATEAIRGLLVESITAHARSDVPVGTCLSGGLDSSAIICLAQNLREVGRIPSYAHTAVGYVTPDPTLSERPYMDAVVRRTGAEMHHVSVPTGDFAEILPWVVAQQDEPFGSASIGAQWLVFQEARRQGLTVMLDGQGADEILAGYDGYRAIHAASMLRRGRLAAYRELEVRRRREGGARLISTWGAAALLASAAVPRGWSPHRRASIGPGHALMTPRLAALTSHEPDEGVRSLDQALRLHTTALNLPALLRYEDRNSMAHSIEARVPFLDHRIVDFVFRLPERQRMLDGRPKGLLRRALRQVVPPEVVERTDKVGFRADPGVTWMLARHDRAARLTATAHEDRWFRRDAVERLLAGSERTVEAEFLSWRVLNLKLWARQQFGGQAPNRLDGRETTVTWRRRA